MDRVAYVSSNGHLQRSSEMLQIVLRGSRQGIVPSSNVVAMVREAAARHIRLRVHPGWLIRVHEHSERIDKLLRGIA
jgi:hypothetical protein